MKCLGVIVLFALVSSLSGNEDVDPIVKTPLGKLKGYYKASFKGRQFRAFEGIPYAKPPVGKLRFEPPEAFGSWQGTLLTMRRESPCLQYAHVPMNPPERVEGAEDCLYLNVYSPTREDSTELLPVIFYIHGGAFQFGEGSSNRPDYLMDRDLVMVTTNYRLGPLGFLSTGDKVVPGNMGLKDQNMALRWVSENIKYFGGNPKKITLAGLSAGGASVHYHYLSPLSRGLFHAGMSFSGTALDCWTQTERSVEKGKKLADILGCPTRDNEEMVNCLRSRPAKSIVQLVGNFMPWLFNPYTPFGPVVEKKSSNSFIHRSPIDIITSGEAADVPWLTTVTSEEGLYPAAEFVAKPEYMEDLDQNWDLLAPYLLDYNFTIPKSEHASVAQKIRQHYLDGKEIKRETAQPLIHMMGDRLFVVDGEKAAREMSRAHRSPVWFYLYTYRGEFSLSDDYIPTKDDFGVSHGDDVFTVIRRDHEPWVTGKSLGVQNTLLDIWTSFASNGSPRIGVKWPQLNPSDKSLKYLHISGPEKPQIEENSNLGDKKFWESIDFDENIPTDGFGDYGDC
ncbi:venom carboxylesterase-6-like isoform X2 [Diachasmimorpha longicaudata]|uniref:venom carboxylesterase-6-like isoform X2 n=1 Tax=Diachasmimorpha longicaudata TaxID=58733 RepID=UPI0030B8BD55